MKLHKRYRGNRTHQSTKAQGGTGEIEHANQPKLREHELEVEVGQATTECNPLFVIEVNSFNECTVGRPHNEVTSLFLFLFCYGF